MFGRLLAQIRYWNQIRNAEDKLFAHQRRLNEADRFMRRYHTPDHVVEQDLAPLRQEVAEAEVQLDQVISSRPSF